LYICKGAVSQRCDVAEARPPPIRITHSTRLIRPRLMSVRSISFNSDPFRDNSADCVSFGDSAATSKRRVVPRHRKSASFYTDLRRAALTGGAADVQKPLKQHHERTHARGVQRLNSAAKHRRSLDKRYTCFREISV